MRSCFPKTLSLVLGALGAAVLVLVLLESGVLSLSPGSAGAGLFFTAAGTFSLLGGLALVCGALHGERTPALAYAWLYWGRWIGTGVLGGVLTPLIFSLTASSGALVHVGTALCVCFLTVELGSLLGCAGKYATARFCCCGR